MDDVRAALVALYEVTSALRGDRIPLRDASVNEAFRKAKSVIDATPAKAQVAVMLGIDGHVADIRSRGNVEVIQVANCGDQRFCDGTSPYDLETYYR